MFGQLFINFLLVIGILIFWQMGQAVGAAVVRLGQLKIQRPLDRILITTALGWLLIGFAIYLLGLLGFIHPLILGIGAVLLAVLTLREEPWRNIQELHFVLWLRALPTVGKVFLLLLGALVTLNLVSALAPDIWFDSTWYHLPEAQLYLERHATKLIYPSILDISSVAPRLPEMLFTFLLAPATQLSTLPQLLQWLTGLGLLLGTYALARRLVQPELAILAGLVVYATKIVGWLSQTAYIDLIQTYFGVAAMIAIFALKMPSNWPRRLLIGALVGGFMASKMQSLAYYPVFLLLLAGSNLQLDHGAKNSWKEIALDIVCVTGISFVVLLPWYLEIWFVTGSPLFILQQPSGSELLGGGQTFAEWVFTIHPQRFLGDISTMLVTDAPLLLASLLSLLFWRSLPALGRLTLASGWLAAFLWSYFPVHLDRYGILIFPLLSIPFVWLASQNRAIRYAVFAATLAIIAFNSSIYRQIASDRWLVALGLVSREDYLSGNLAGHNLIYYDPGSAIANIVKGGKALALVHNPFYLNISTIDAVNLKATSYGQLTSMSEVITQWKANGITHLLIHGPWVLETFVDQTEFPGGGTALSVAEREKIEDYVTLRYTNNYTTVWELR